MQSLFYSHMLVYHICLLKKSIAFPFIESAKTEADFATYSFFLYSNRLPKSNALRILRQLQLSTKSLRQHYMRQYSRPTIDIYLHHTVIHINFQLYLFACQWWRL